MKKNKLIGSSTAQRLTPVLLLSIPNMLIFIRVILTKEIIMDSFVFLVVVNTLFFWIFKWTLFSVSIFTTSDGIRLRGLFIKSKSS